ncbi:sugar ABC transporter permease YjfF [Prauserella muralis]|uniref:Sugar ABC transporter permease YjfF n=1 Tax=Prauserella muralis TaxID=588067 RepID=A0A2V4B2W5_9PSEU|nr:sugar ABC transporter permease YjfF [Prauserella muralis]
MSPLDPRYLPIAATVAILLAAYVFGVGRYDAFSDGQVLLNILVDNAFLLVVAVGMTFVILTGGIDLSVGSVVALATVMCAVLTEQAGLPAVLVIPIVLATGALLGLGMGSVIHYFEIQPFVVTLAGMFLARGLAYTLSTESISMDDGVFTAIAQTPVPLPGGLHLSISATIAVCVVLVAAYLLHYTRLGRTVYAIGGNKRSAFLMGLPVARTRVTVYTISGFCAALGGVLLTFYTLSGNSLNAVGLELDAIAAVVIGGTVLMGGFGFVLGTVLGVFVLGLIQTLIIFEGTLSSWWTRIAIGVMLLLFILLQRLIVWRAR